MSAAVALDFPDSHYSPEMNRFVSEDPIDVITGNLNFYNYVGGNPIRKIDPSGLFCLDAFYERFKRNFKTTTQTTSIVSDSAAFAVALDVALDQGLVTSSTRSLSNIFSLFGRLGAREKFNTIRKLGPAFGKAIAKNLGEGLLTGLAIEGSFLAGVATGSALEALVAETFSPSECDKKVCK